MPENPFERLARYYDWEHAGFEDDVPFYLGLAERVGGPILEPFCGSGRLLLPMARAGYDIVGLDTSPTMLARAEAALGREPDLRPRVRLLQADVCSARFDGQFGLAVAALDSFGLLVEQDDQLRALRNLRRHIHRDGLLALDVGNGNLRGGEALEELNLHRDGRLDEYGTRLAKWARRRTDPAAQLDRYLLLYDETGPDGLVHRTEVKLVLRYFTRFELELLLERAGFFVEAVFGDYDLAPFGPASPRLIAIAHVRRR